MKPTIEHMDVIGIIGKRIKYLRITQGYTSAEIFAYDHELDKSSYCSMEKGRNMTIVSLLRLCDIHHITIKEFFEGI